MVPSPRPKHPIKIPLLHDERAATGRTTQRDVVAPAPPNKRLPRGTAYVLGSLQRAQEDLALDPRAQEIAQATWGVRVALRLLRWRRGRLARILARHRYRAG